MLRVLLIWKQNIDKFKQFALIFANSSIYFFTV